MKIVEKIEKDCCLDNDLLPYNGKMPHKTQPQKLLLFCKHCGQIWIKSRVGSMVNCWKKVELKI